jgi:predicted acylesterase/phospholipase RssA
MIPLRSATITEDQPPVTSYQRLIPRPQSRPIRILSIDGGGIRGIIPALVLARIEKLTGRPVAKLFDLVAGTSTGGILALGLTIPKSPGKPLYAAQEFVSMFEREGPKIFSRSLFRAFSTTGSLTWKKYSARGIEQVLAEYFGDSRLREAVTDVLVPSYEIERRFPFFFKSTNARRRPDYDFPAREVARATSAAPSYFEPLRISNSTNSERYSLIDGGVFANNPAACALVEARSTHALNSSFLVVSLGTGSLMRKVPRALARYAGAVLWAKPLLDAIFDGVSSTVDYQLRRLLPNGYYRFQAALTSHTEGLDNTSRRNLEALKSLTNNLIEKNSAEIEELCGQLTSSRLQKD